MIKPLLYSPVDLEYGPQFLQYCYLDLKSSAVLGFFFPANHSVPFTLFFCD